MSILEIFKMFLQKEKILYSSLNKLKKEEKLFLGFCWIPQQDKQKILSEIEGLKEKNRNVGIPDFKIVSDHGVRPPSLFRTNEFTAVFQEIVNTYGIPTYKEVNPGLFTIVTFPFEFGIMFGDIGHGSILFLAGVILCLLSPVLKAKVPAMEGVLSIRYIILMMGLFAAYCGFIYNDLMAIPLWIFKSCYNLKEESLMLPSGELKYIAKLDSVTPDCVYPIGIDPAWYLGINELTFLNSLKMKLAVIIGVS